MDELKSAVGSAAQTPFRPMKWGRIKAAGIKNRICRERLTSIDSRGFPTAIKYPVLTT